MLRSYFQFLAYDNNQSYLRRCNKRHSRSFVQGFLKLHYAWTTVGNISVTDVEGAGQTASGSAGGLVMHATSPGRGASPIAYTPGFDRSDADWLSVDAGIVVGTGTTAVAPTDYQLATRIADGTSSGKLEYFPCGGTNPTTSGTAGSFTLERLFRNSSSGTITINEVGVYSIERSSGNVGFPVCMIRDIVSPGFAVLNGEYMRIIYTITVTA